MFRRSISSACSRFLAVLGVAVLGAGALTVSLAAPAAAVPLTFTVQTSGNGVSGIAADGICDASVAAGTQCTLKEAIKESNGNADTDTIAFDTAAFATPYRITMSGTGMLDITDQVVIDGTTQPGYAPSTGVIVRYDGASLGLDGFTMQSGADGTVIKGLVMTRWDEAVKIFGNNNAVSGNWLGVPSTGSVSGLGNNIGVQIEGGNDNTVGGTAGSDRNVIGQNGSFGVRVDGTDPSGDPTAGNADGNQVLGNYIGVRDDGATAVANGEGVRTEQAVDTVVGTATGPNLVSGNSSRGVFDLDSSGTTVEANLVGTNAAGTAAVPNYEGVRFGSSDGLLIEDNLISGNSYAGLTGDDAFGDPSDIDVVDNRIGTDQAGSGAVPNYFGIYALDYYTAAVSTIDLRGNTVSGNDYYGAYLDSLLVTAEDNLFGTASAATPVLGNGSDGLAILNARGGTVTGNTISGNGRIYGGSNGLAILQSRELTVTDNSVGTDPARTVDVGNNGRGIFLNDTHDSVIGGTGPGDANYLSGNEYSGIELHAGSSENLIRGNTMGRGAAGESIPNVYAGVYLNTAVRNTIGGTASGAGNLIADNPVAGVLIDNPGTANGNLILGNSIVGNGLGIDLGYDGVTANDTGDGDSGPNARQNFPVLTEAGSDGSVTVMEGTLNSRPDRDYRLEFFANDSCHASGNGEGERYLGSSTVTTDSTGNVTFTSTLPSAVVGLGEQVTATATDLRRDDTSEFSQCVGAIGLPTASIDDVTVTEGDSGTQNATFTVTLSASPTVAASVRATTAPGTATTPSDFTAVDTVVNFGIGETSKTVNVPVKGDTTDEFDENYTVELSEPDSLTIADGSGLGTITDNDPEPSVSVGDVTINEPTSGTANAAMVFQLSKASAKPVSVKFATASGTASSSDYGPRGLTVVSFVPGQTSRTINITVKSDTRDEPNQTFFVNLSAPTNVTISDPQAQVTIVDTDPTPTISIADVTTTEGNSGFKTFKFNVTLSNPSDSSITVAYTTTDGTAVQPSDYVTRAGTLTWTPGSTTRTVSVSVRGDTVVEPDEAFTADLSGATNATIGDAQGIGTIQNDD